MQKLDFNEDGKLVAYTDNGCTDGDSATTEIKGTFEVSADVVKFILAKEYGLPSSIVAKIKKYMFGFPYSENLHFSLDNYSINIKINELEMRIKEVDKEREQYKTEIKGLCEEKKELEKENLAFKNAIDDFNRTRRFWEREIKVLKAK